MRASVPSNPRTHRLAGDRACRLGRSCTALKRDRAGDSAGHGAGRLTRQLMDWVFGWVFSTGLRGVGAGTSGPPLLSANRLT
jgi:hypothetical protein